MVSIRVIGEDNAIVLASGQAEFELDAMALATAPRPGAGYAEPFVAVSSIRKKRSPRRRRNLTAWSGGKPALRRIARLQAALSHRRDMDARPRRLLFWPVADRQ